jgi:hypothetical protein
MTTKIPQDVALKLLLAAYAGNEPSTSYIEIRTFDPEMKPRVRRWMPVGELDQAAKQIVELVGRLHVYVGAAPRTRREGTADAVARVWALWADLDSRQALERLRDFRPLPSIVTRSGTPNRAHAAWQLREPIPPAWAQRGNRRLALRLDGDLGATDPARVLRTPLTLNHKHSPPRPTLCTRLELDAFTFDEIVGGLPDDRTYVAPPQPKLAPRTTDPDKALTGLERTVRDAPETNRNKALYWAACRIRDDDNIDRDQAREVLTAAAADAGLAEHEIHRTLSSALEATA